MSKGLEAFNRILGNDYFNVIISSRINGKRQYANDVAIVEEELKRLEELDNGAYVSIHINRYNELCDKEEELEFIKKCFYVAKSSGAILRTDYGFEHEEELKEVLL